MSKTLITVFSASGTTLNVAKQMAEATHNDFYEIKPEHPYTLDDLNWLNKESRTSKEMSDSHSRPALKNHNASIEDYETIFIGFPIWWYVAPTIINTFLESYDFKNKKIVLFATSGGSGFGKALQSLKESLDASTTIVEGDILNGHYTKEALKQFVERYQ